jgi:hypothetical protein
MFSKPYMASGRHEVLAGNGCFIIKCATKSIMAEAIAKRISAITIGCASNKPILVAVEAEAHRIANRIPALTHLRFLLTSPIKASEGIRYLEHG